jgi:2-iminoacetate synthase
MTAYDKIKSSINNTALAFGKTAGSSLVERTLQKERLLPDDIPVLLSSAADAFLEQMACRAAELTRQHFGNTIQIFTPLYISNFCDNGCPYCSFSCKTKIGRKKLDQDEIRGETASISKAGIRNILVLTGESHDIAGFDYVYKSIKTIAESFASIGIEMFPMGEKEYGLLVKEGVDSLTIYQEVYDETKYAEYHRVGLKKDYRYRLETADRGCRAGIRAVNLGALLGLGETVSEMYMLALHACHILDEYPDVELGFSFPRIRPLAGNFNIPDPVSEAMLVRIISVFRMVFPFAGITVSTRESEKFRNGVLPIGVTKMSAGVSTAVGGHSDSEAAGQFEIADNRSVVKMREDLSKRGFLAVMHNWNMKLSSDNGNINTCKTAG